MEHKIVRVVLYPKRRCKHRSKQIAWCVLKGKFCNAPEEYETCADYEQR